MVGIRGLQVGDSNPVEVSVMPMVENRRSSEHTEECLCFLVWY